MRRHRRQADRQNQREQVSRLMETPRQHDRELPTNEERMATTGISTERASQER